MLFPARQQTPSHGAHMLTCCMRETHQTMLHLARQQKDSVGVPANLHSLNEDHAGIAAEPTISKTSKDISPDRSALGTG